MRLRENTEAGANRVRRAGNRRAPTPSPFRRTNTRDLCMPDAWDSTQYPSDRSWPYLLRRDKRVTELCHMIIAGPIIHTTDTTAPRPKRAPESFLMLTRFRRWNGPRAQNLVSFERVSSNTRGKQCLSAWSVVSKNIRPRPLKNPSRRGSGGSQPHRTHLNGFTAPTPPIRRAARDPGRLGSAPKPTPTFPSDSGANIPRRAQFPVGRIAPFRSWSFFLPNPTARRTINYTGPLGR